MALADDHVKLVEEITEKVLESLGLESQLQSQATEASQHGSKVFASLKQHHDEVVKTLGGSVDRCLNKQAALCAENVRIMGCVQALLGTLYPSGHLSNSWPAAAGSVTELPRPQPHRSSSNNTKMEEECSSEEETIFTVTLRKADGASLGLKISCDDATMGLSVEDVLAGGAVEAWNRQCAGDLHRFFAGGPGPRRAVIPGDRIIEVNGISGDPPRMSSECTSKRLLKIKIQRGAIQKQNS